MDRILLFLAFVPLAMTAVAFVGWVLAALSVVLRGGLSL